ncbi:MAG: Hpt domain-containing protein [Gammaproteobacteria bacterium]|nr:Hpt domain-containing protein [Gammaproteobacteria bacterium]
MQAQQLKTVEPLNDELYMQLRLDYIEHIIKNCQSFSLRARTNKSIKSIYSLNQEILRSIHSIKGSSPMYDISIIGKICHHLEDILSNNYLINNLNNNSYIENLTAYLDLIRLTALVEKEYIYS